MKLGDCIYHCKRTVTDDIVTYSAPIKYRLQFNYLTVQPTRVALNNMSGFYTTEEFGEHNATGWNAIANMSIFGDQFGIGDLLYLDGAVPSNNDEKGANAIITSIRYQNKAIFMTIKNLEGE